MRDYYASQGVHLELRASRLVWLGAGAADGAPSTGCTRDALRRLGADGDPPPDRALVAGVTLGETGALPADVRDRVPRVRAVPPGGGFAARTSRWW